MDNVYSITGVTGGNATVHYCDGMCGVIIWIDFWVTEEGSGSANKTLIFAMQEVTDTHVHTHACRDMH